MCGFMCCYAIYGNVLLSALGWILYCLAMYKEHQEECRKEIREVLAGRDSDDITW